MKKNILATSIIEAMVVLLVVLMAITGAYDMFSKAIRVTDGSEHKLMAVSIAKEWIEAVINIRDTNWKVLPWDYKNCWNVLNYNLTCFGNDNNTPITDIANNWSYIVDKDPTDFRWKLNSFATWLYSSQTYRGNFQVWLSGSWFYTQSWSSTTSLKPIFTREIQIKYLDDWELPNNIPADFSNEQKMQVKSIVQWKDSSSDKIRKVEMETIITNWKNKKDN